MSERCGVAGETGPPLGSILRRLRLAAGLSQEALAERARMSVNAVSALERGARQAPQRQTLALLIEGLGLDDDAAAELEAAVVRRSLPRRRVESAAPRAVVRNSNLPFALTSFIGREDERSMLAGRLSAERLLTLAGTGGVGKTRLAIEIGHDVLERFDDGVWLVQLEGLRDESLIVPAICSALGVREVAGTPLIETLLSALRPSDHLLILDNCEHLVDAVAALLQTLLAACPGLRAIATSRQPLRVIGERVHRVAPLALPPSGETPAHSESAAERLFIDRARAVDASFQPNGDALAAVRTIVRRLDGLPLAIELAAANVEMLSVPAIAERLDRRLGLLTSEVRAAIPHQVTMRALIDWSYDQLDPFEQVLFRRLAVFSGGWTLEAVETMAADSGLNDADIFALLTRLHDKSLVVSEPRRGRFRMLETIREYAAEKLDAANERRRYEDQHAAYFLDFAARIGKGLRDARQPEALAAIALEVDNIRAAIDVHGIFEAREERVLHALAAMMDYWFLTGAYSEGRARAEALLARGLRPSVALAAAYYGTVPIALSDSRYGDARRFAAAAAAASGGAGGDLLEGNIVAAALMADILDAQPVAPERILAVRAEAQRSGRPDRLLPAAMAQGFAAIGRADVVEARVFFEEALGFARATGDPSAVAAAALLLARLALIGTEPQRAVGLLAEAVPVLAGREDLSALASALDGLTVVGEAMSEPAFAAFALGAARRMHRVSGTTAATLLRPPVSGEIVDRIRIALGAPAFEERVAAGERAFPADVVDAVRSFRP